jgi:phosphoribosyl 1,2-cyclic phosphodiesterase
VADANLSDWRLKLRFWGVRGSVPTPQKRNMGYGGNTSCLEVTLPSGEILVFDAGTGICELGPSLLDQKLIHIFFTHLHWDHLQGLPFFAPLYGPDTLLKFYSSSYCGELKNGLESQMRRPHFPVDFEKARSRREFIDMGISKVHIGPATITPFPLNHPNGACGYRIECGGAVIVYATDREHGHAELDSLFDQWAQGADLLIHDAQYRPEEFDKYRNWGHSTWEEAVRVANLCGVKQLALFHHDPKHDDDMVAAIETAARKQCRGAFAAREGMTITL